MRELRRVAWPVIAFCVAEGFQVSNYQNIWLAYGLWSLAFLLWLQWIIDHIKAKRVSRNNIERFQQMADKLWPKEPWPKFLADITEETLGMLGIRTKPKPEKIVISSADDSVQWDPSLGIARGMRLVLDDTPESMTGLFKGLTTVQSQNLKAEHLGKWMKIPGRVKDVTDRHQNRNRMRLSLEGYDKMGCDTLPAEHPFLYLDFNRTTWHHRLSQLKRGDAITVTGQISDISLHVIALDNCEL